VIVLAVRWYLRFGLSYRDLEELLTERGVEVDHVTVVALCLPRDRPVRAGHRRVRRPTARRQGSPSVLERAIGTTKVLPVEVVTDRAATYPIVLEELLPAPRHRTEQYANNRVECDHGRLKRGCGRCAG
jgi:transposase-like protein